jgi:hypothetical protein
MFEDATDKIKKSKRNKTLVDPFGFTSYKWFFKFNGFKIKTLS